MDCGSNSMNVNHTNSTEINFLDSEVGIKEEQDVDFVVPKKFEVNRLAIQEVQKEDQVSEVCDTYFLKPFLHNLFLIIMLMFRCNLLFVVYRISKVRFCMKIE